jgi:hypothetical protein
MKFIVINPELMQSVVKATGSTKKRKTKAKPSVSQKDQSVWASNRYPNKKKK